MSTTVLERPTPPAHTRHRRTLVVNVNDPSGWDVHLCRATPLARDPRLCHRSPWRNPWQEGLPHPEHGRRMTRDDTLELFEFRTIPYLRAMLNRHRRPDFLDEQLAALAGRRLGCTCPPVGLHLTGDDSPVICHGQIIARLADKAGGL